MPLPLGDRGDLDKQPLASDVLETRLDDAELHSATRVNKDLGQTGGPTGADLSPDTLTKVDDARPHGPTPALVAKTVLGAVEGEGGNVLGID